MKINKVPTIKTPLWSMKGFGVADKYFIDCDFVEVTCSYKTKDGSLLYPGKYYFASSHRNMFKPQMCGATLLRWCPAASSVDIDKNEKAKNSFPSLKKIDPPKEKDLFNL